MNGGIGTSCEGPGVRRLAVVGKGGVGKTAFTAMLTRVLAEDGKAGRLLVIDADPALGLTHALGMRVERTMGQVREDILAVARSGVDAQMTEIAGMLDYMVMEALVEDENLALLAMGRSESLGCFCPVNDILRDAIRILSQTFDTILIDGEAGLEQINRQVMDELDWLIMITDPSSRGLQTVALLKEIVDKKEVVHCTNTGLIFNRVESSEDLLAKAAAGLGVDVLGFIPQDPAITGYDLVGRSLAELPADSPAVLAVRSIAAVLSPSGTV
jgi:CO dehydrogenase maturation factor